MSSNDPRIERALEEFFENERLSRRGFIGRAGSSGLALSGLAAVLATGTLTGTTDIPHGDGWDLAGATRGLFVSIGSGAALWS